MTRRSPLLLAALAASLALALAGWGGLRGEAGSPQPGEAAPMGAGPAEGAAGLSVLAAAPTVRTDPGHAGAGDAEAVKARIFGEGSLRGTQPDGDWGVDANGELRPALALRQRFDYFLSALGEATVEELTALMMAEATREVGPAAAARIREVWDRYLALQQHPTAHAVRLEDPATWELALNERQLLRRRLLGPAWAEAFYREEEAALQQRIAQARAAPAGEAPVAGAAQHDAPTPPAALLVPDGQLDAAELHRQRSEHFGSEAAERLRQQDEAFAAWRARLDAARAQLRQIEADASLSPLLRDQARSSYLQAHFDEGEQLRARALLGLPP